MVWPLGGIPDFGRFLRLARRTIVSAALAGNLPIRSPENEFTDGRVGRVFGPKGRYVLYGSDELKRLVLATPKWHGFQTGSPAKDLRVFRLPGTRLLPPFPCSAGTLQDFKTSQDLGWLGGAPTGTAGGRRPAIPVRAHGCDK